MHLGVKIDYITAPQRSQCHARLSVKEDDQGIRVSIARSLTGVLTSKGPSVQVAEVAYELLCVNQRMSPRKLHRIDAVILLPLGNILPPFHSQALLLTTNSGDGLASIYPVKKPL